MWQKVDGGEITLVVNINLIKSSRVSSPPLYGHELRQKATKTKIRLLRAGQVPIRSVPLESASVYTGQPQARFLARVEPGRITVNTHALIILSRHVLIFHRLLEIYLFWGNQVSIAVC